MLAASGSARRGEGNVYHAHVRMRALVDAYEYDRAKALVDAYKYDRAKANVPDELVHLFFIISVVAKRVLNEFISGARFFGTAE